MNEIVSFTKEINFNNNIDRIISISLEHTIGYDNESSVRGDLIVSGSFRQSPITLIDTPFSYRIPVDIVLDSRYDLSNITIDIDNFTYDLIDNNKLKIDVDLLIDNLELGKEDELINVNDLFLEKEEDKKELEIPVKESNEDNVAKEEKPVLNDSLFSNLTFNETYVTYSIYVIKEGDTIEDIMDKYKVSRTELEEYNDLESINQGTKIIIPSSNE